MSSSKVVTIGISGASCSGKTTLALLLKKLLKRVIVINQDEFYKPDDQIPKDEKTGLANWDSPGAVDFKRLNKAIDQARLNPDAILAKKEKPLQNNHHGSDLLSAEDFVHLSNQLISLHDIVFVVVEGFLLFCDKDVCDNLDNKFFVAASRDTLKRRRESRRGYVTLQGYWVDPPGYFDDVVWPQYVLWNGWLMDPAQRDPSIHVFNTDENSSKDVTSAAVHLLAEKHHIATNIN